MASIINTNISSLNAQRQLSGSQNSLATSMQRLSSGLRINSAKDDAAGLAISERMTAQIKGLNQAGRNANDGISLAQTAEGALSTIGNNLQRIRELAVQSRNATNSADDRAALQKEVTQLVSEIDRVAKTTSFNGTKLLDGSFSAQSFQVGANQGETINIASIANASTDSLGEWTSVGTTDYESSALTLGTAADAASFTVNGVTINVAAEVGRDAAGALTDVDAAFNAAKTANAEALAGVTISAGVLTSVGADAAGPLTVAAGTNVGAVTLTATEVDGTDQTGIADVDISSVEGADNAMLAMDAALKSINGARADLGAIQNRFESVVSNLATTAENLTASRSRIQDADFAAETANLSRAQILQQAGTAMVAQANQLPQTVMSLLR
ncbi:flagellin [Xenophilus arseniciresistens]|uniref:Flagellin n=1 Tax=Xenophilus arseniciresistens TaxID=1283306 RepID=A0AAE3N5I4_9BURK|nr:flagellin [Xenophilus arseniciresistens]MDA7415238.1 flagellin [Xenophilus arseniciresistens]